MIKKISKQNSKQKIKNDTKKEKIKVLKKNKYNLNSKNV